MRTYDLGRPIWWDHLKCLRRARIHGKRRKEWKIPQSIHSLPEKPFSCQNYKCKNARWRRVSVRAKQSRWRTCVVSCQNCPIIGHITSWNAVLKTMFTGSTSLSLPNPNAVFSVSSVHTILAPERDHPRRPKGSLSGQEKRRDECFQVQTKEPLGTDFHSNYFQKFKPMPTPDWAQKMLCTLCPIGEQFLLSSFREFIHDGYCLATLPRFLHQACACKENFYFPLS